MDAVVAVLVRILEGMFLVGMIGCAAAVIPITAFRLFSVLFEPATEEEERHASPATPTIQ